MTFNGLLADGNKWLLNFDSSKTKLMFIKSTSRSTFTFHQHIADANFLDGNSLHFLGFTFPTDMTWNDYIESNARCTARMFGSLSRARQLLLARINLACLLPYHSSIDRILLGHLVWCPGYTYQDSWQIQSNFLNVNSPDLASRLESSPHIVMWYPCVSSINIFIAIVLMGIPLWYLDHMNFNVIIGS